MKRLSRSLVEPWVRHPVAVVLAVVLVAAGGALALAGLPVDLFPGMNVPLVNVISHDPAAAAPEIERLVTRPVEDAMRTIPGVRRVSSISSQGISRVGVEFAWGTRLADARQEVQSKLAEVRARLPAAVVPRLENIGTTLDEVAGYVVYGGGDPVDLRSTVLRDVSSRLMGVPGVSRIDVQGGDEPAFVVTLKTAALARLGLTVDEVARAIRSDDLVSTSGYLDRGSRDELIVGDGRIRTLEDLGRVPVAERANHPVLLATVASIARGRVPRHYVVHGDGKPAVAFLVRKAPNASTIAVVNRVNAELAKLQRVLPHGARVRMFYDQADILVSERNDLLVDLLVGAGLAAAVLLLFLGNFRATVVVAAAIPVTLLATLGVMDLMGETLNVVTLSALTLAVGMVVDDAIVVAESVVRHLAKGGDRAEASVAGVEEIAAADASGTLTTVAAFVPLLLTGGIVGIFVRPFGAVIATALLASLFVSIFLVPPLLARAGRTASSRAPGARLLSASSRMLGRTLGFALRHRSLVVATAVAVIAGAFLLLPVANIRVLPPIDEGAILIEYTMPPGTSLSESNRVADALERRAMKDPDVTTVYRRTGSPALGFSVEGPNKGEMTILLEPRSERSRSAADVIDDLRRAYSGLPGMVVVYHGPTQEKMDESFSGLPSLFGVTISGADESELVAAAARVEKAMDADPAIHDVINNTKIRAPEIVVKPRRPDLARYGVDQATVLDTLDATRLGVVAIRIPTQRQQIQVILRIDQDPGASISALSSIEIPRRARGFVPLSRVADVRVKQVPAQLTRLNGVREVTLPAEVEGSIPAAVDRLTRSFSKLHLPRDVHVSFTGQYAELTETILTLGGVALAATALIYLLLVATLSSWAAPFLVLATIPAALAGGAAALGLTRSSLDLSAGMAALTLIGIAVNNAILLLDAARTRGLVEAALIRLKPILLTAGTTIAGLLPVAVSPSLGSRVFQPFAIAVIGGLVLSTAASLILVPTLAGFSRAYRTPSPSPAHSERLP